MDPRSLILGVTSSLFLFGSSVLGAAEILDLATNQDGSVVYFASTLRLKGSDEGFTSKIFKLDTRLSLAPVLIAERKIASKEYTSLHFPAVSGDGAVSAYNGRTQCFVYICASFNSSSEPNAGTVTLAAGKAVTFPDMVALSRNGHYAAFLGEKPVDTIFRYDLTTETFGPSDSFRGLAAGPVAGHPVISSNGVAFMGNATQILTFDGTRSQIYAAPAYNLAIDDQGQTVVYDTGTFGDAKSQINWFDPSTGASFPFIQAFEGVWAPALSSDGSTLLFLSRANFSARNNQSHTVVFLMKTDGSNLRQITSSDDEIASAALSGDGTIVYAATASNRLLRITLADGSQQELIPTTPALAANAFEVSPGGLVVLKGVGLSASSKDAGSLSSLPRNLDGVSVTINGMAAPLLSIASDEIVAQVPWETPVSERLPLLDFLPPDYGPLPVSLTITTPTTSLSSPFDGLAAGLYVTDFAPTFLSRESNGNLTSDRLCFQRGGLAMCNTIAAHEDFQSLVTTHSPAHPGEFIHLYMTGLGAVQPAQLDGVGAPVAPLVKPLPCTLTVTDTNTLFPLEIPYAGLAPGLVGVYQVDMHIPESVPVGVIGRLLCGDIFGSIPLG